MSHVIAAPSPARRTRESSTRLPRIAIVHDWLPLYGGAERVLEQMLEVFPDADLFSVVDLIKPGQRQFLKDKPVATTFIQKLPFVRRWYRHYLPLMPVAIEQLDLSSYPIVITSSYAVAKGVITGPDQLHICYNHSPIRFAWDLQHQYLARSGMSSGPLGAILRLMLHYIRMWDVRTSHGVDSFIANSSFVARRIWKVYNREAEAVIHPPVDTESFTLHEGEREPFYFTASRLVPYKRVDLIIEAFSWMPDKKLVVVGDGPEFAKLKAMATPNVTMLGYQSHDRVVDLMQRARAFVFAAEEDFGIVPVEAQSCGTPVIAFGRGGARETVRPYETGILFEPQTAEGLIDAVEEFESLSFDPKDCRKNALRFSVSTFRKAFESFVQSKWKHFLAERAMPA